MKEFYTKKKYLKKSSILFILFFLISSFNYANVTITPATTLNINTCLFPSSYSNLSNIVIREGNNADFGLSLMNTNYTLILTAPSNFEFNPSVGTVGFLNADITAATILVTATTITITYQSNEANRTNETDQITISGIQVRAITSASTGNILRLAASPGTGVIAGIVNGSTNFGSLNSSVITIPSITGNPNNQSIIVGSNTSFSVLASNSPTSYTWEVSSNGGGLWTTVVNGGVYSNATGATLNITNATIGMDGNLYRANATNACGTSSFSTNATLTVNYCIPSATPSVNNTHISFVGSVGTLTENSNTTGLSAGGYGNFSSIILASQIPGGGINIDLTLASNNSTPQYVEAYVDWNKDGVFTDALPERVYSSGIGLLNTSFGYIVPAAQAAGTYRLRIRTTEPNINIIPCALGYTSGETEDYSFNVVADCAQKITSVSDGNNCGTNTVLIGATSAGATGFKIYSAETGGTLIADITSANSFTWTTPPISTTTYYYVTAYNATCETLYRTPIKATINIVTDVTVTPASPIVCGEDSVIQITAGGDIILQDILSEDFESSGLGAAFKFSVVTPTNTPIQAAAPWSIQASVYPSPTNFWKPAINSGAVASSGNKFAITISDYSGLTLDTRLTSSTAMDISGFSEIKLTFDHFFSYYGGETAYVEASTNNTTWSIIKTYTSEQGSATKFITDTVDLSAYSGQSNLYIRFRYTAIFKDGWAVDNIYVYGKKPLNTTFLWTGTSGIAFNDAACLIPYDNTSRTTIWVKPTLTQLEQASWLFTASGNLGNGCTLNKPITVTNNTKIWKGASNNDWNNTANWAPAAVPDVNTCVIIPASTQQITGLNYNAYGKNLTIKSGGNLEIQQGNNLTINDWIDIKTNGNLTVRDDANLIQINETDNNIYNGTYIQERLTTLKPFDYVYWSSPIKTNITSFSTGNIFPTSTYKYKWIPTIPSNTFATINGQWGNWATANENMTVGKGYIIRTPAGWSGTSYNATFTGRPNNGTLTATVQRGTYTGADYNTGVSTTLGTKDDDNWNLVGNPYPSSINAKEFLSANSNLEGFVKIWTHGTTLSSSNSSPFYNTFGYNYSPLDYITYNATGATIQSGFDGSIASGQGFIVRVLDTAPTSSTVTFTNGMRRDASGNSYSNSSFFRTANSSIEEGNRIWIDLLTPQTVAYRSLLGYVYDATDDIDRLFDARTNNKNSVNFYSIINEEIFTIQGRSLPFNENDMVKLGYKTSEKGQHKIAIAKVDGLFTNQDIYLKDNENGTIHDLKIAPYSFNSEIGVFNNRFEIIYKNATLSIDNFDYYTSVKISSNQKINIESSIEPLKRVEIFDILGKSIFVKDNVNLKSFSVNELNKTQNVLLVRITLESGAIVTKKIIY